MSNVGDLLQITHKYQVAGQECNNVFFYEVSASTGGAFNVFDLLGELEARYQTALNFVWANTVTSTSITIENLSNGLEFGQKATGFSGSVAAQTLPSFVAASVTLPRLTKLTRSGAKRVAGIPEDVVNGNVYSPAAQAKAGLEDYCAGTILLQNFNGQGDDVTLQGVIVGRVKQPDGSYILDISIRNLYGLPQVSSTISSQNSRKP